MSPRAIKPCRVNQTGAQLWRFRTDWASAKVLLGDSNFLKKLYDLDKDNISDATLKKLRKYVDNPKFTPDEVAKVSKVCTTSPFAFPVAFAVQASVSSVDSEL